MGNPFFGINAHLASRYQGDPTAPVALLRDSGAGWVREELRWDMVRDFDNNRWNFDGVDRMLQPEMDTGIQVLGLLGYNTQAQQNWITDWHLPEIGPWQEYVHETVTHFNNKINAWEVWNEPNNVPWFWRDETTSEDDSIPPADADIPRRIDNYIRLLRATHETIKAINPGMEVISAGCSNVNPPEWLNIFRDRDGTRWCDAIGVHPYVPRGSMESGRFKTFDLPRLLTFQQSVGMSLWFTEVGWSSAADTGGDVAGSCVGSEQAQADFLAQQYTEILESGIDPGNLGPIFWYDFHEDPLSSGPNPDGAQQHFGLLRRNPNDRNDWTQTKPAFERFKQLAMQPR